MIGRLYLIVDLASLGVVPEAIAGGVDLVQLRDKEARDGDVLEGARELVRLCGDVPVLINDRVHLVAYAGAAGAHVGEDDLAPREARRLLPPGALLGLSTHSAEEVAAAAAEPVDYVGLGPMYTTSTKPLTRTPGGPALLRRTRTTLPLFPIGGITPDNGQALVAAGAERLAVSSAICHARSPRETARRLRRLLETP